MVTTPVKRSQRGRVSRGAGRGESTSSSGNDTGGGGGGGGGGSGGGSGGGVGDGGDGGGGSGRGNKVGDDDSTVFRHAGSSSADVVSGGGGGGGAGGGGGKRSSSSGSFALKERAARRVSARSSGSSSGSGCNHGEASLGAPSSHPLDSVSIGGLASSSGRGARRVSTWSNDSAGSNSREKCEAATDKRVSLLPAPQPCAGVNTSGGSGGDGAGRKGSTSTSSSSGTDRTARRVSTWSTSSGGSSGSVVMDDSVGSIGVCGGSMGGGGGDGGAGGSDSVRFHNKSGYSRSNASGVALGSSGAEYKAKDAGRMLSVSPPAGGMDRRARTAHTTGSATSNTVDSAADAENSAVETNGAPAKAPSSSVRRSAPLCIDGSVVGAASTVGKGLSLASESSLNERAAGRTGTRCSGSGGGIGGGLNVGGGRRLSTPMGGTNVCEGCQERRNAVGGGETAGALCEDCAAEAEEAPRGIKRPRQSTTVSVVVTTVGRMRACSLILRIACLLAHPLTCSIACLLADSRARFLLLVFSIAPARPLAWPDLVWGLVCIIRAEHRHGDGLGSRWYCPDGARLLPRPRKRATLLRSRGMAATASGAWASTTSRCGDFVLLLDHFFLFCFSSFLVACVSVYLLPLCNCLPYLRFLCV